MTTTIPKQNQLTVQEHRRKRCEPSVSDLRVFDGIVSVLSCSADCIAHLDPLPRIASKERISVRIPRRSLLVLTGSARRDYKLSFKETNKRPVGARGNRLSFTFRRVRQNIVEESQVLYINVSVYHHHHHHHHKYYKQKQAHHKQSSQAKA